MNRLISFLLFLLPVFSSAQYHSRLSAQQWVDSVFKTLNNDKKIAQLIIIRAHSNLGPEHVAKVIENIKKYNVGGLCFFQGGPVRQANLTNYYQSIAKTPLMVTIDAEWGLGMRLDSVLKFPYQLTLGAMNDEELMHRMGVAVGEQCKRLGVQVNYAPVVDINNNPANPVIGYRSFGESRDKVTALGVAYMKGMQEAGIMACAKHFPGHGDVDVDSHLDLPVINKSMAQLDTMELIPFKALFKAGVGSVMIAHLSVPAIDNTANRATSISKNNVTGLLRNDLGYQGLTFTDALEMKGVAKYFPGGKISVEALIAGNDMLCLPESVPQSIAAVKKAIKKRKLSWKSINEKVKRVLLAKYNLGLNQINPVDTANLLNDLNAKTNDIRYEVAAKTLSLVKTEGAGIPLQFGKKVAYISIGDSTINEFGARMMDDYNSDNYFFNYKDTSATGDSIIEQLRRGKYETVVVGIHNYSLRPGNNYNISPAAQHLFNQLQAFNTITFAFGNVLALSNFCNAKTLIACYQDDDITREVAADLLEGRLPARGTLPVSVCNFKFGGGIIQSDVKPIPEWVAPIPFDTARYSEKLISIDSIANDAIAKKAFPGCVVVALYNGNVIYNKAFGHFKYEPSKEMTTESIFDLASVTKISATTVALMQLYEEGKLDLNKTLGDYLPVVRGTNKAKLLIKDILMHEAGLVAFIPFYKETIDSVTGFPNPEIYSDTEKPGFNVRVAKGVYLRNDWEDTLMKRIVKSPLGPIHKYVYSDNDFIFLGKIVETLSGMPLNEYVDKVFYSKLGMRTTGFRPWKKFPIENIVPTEEEKHFRRQLLQGDVHDEGASLFGEVAGHAGLFSDAYDLAILYQMLLNGGQFNGVDYLDPSTIKLFTSYHSKISRRGYGFDKPEKNNASREDPYPSLSASPETFGHTGFTGTCVWVDPKYDLVYVFLSNRVYPGRDNPRLSSMRIRGKIQEVLYKAIKSVRIGN